jgi:hypothetical protein
MPIDRWAIAFSEMAQSGAEHNSANAAEFVVIQANAEWPTTERASGGQGTGNVKKLEQKLA